LTSIVGPITITSPLPTVDTVAKVRTPGFPFARKGVIEPAGRPEDDEEAAR
jgi:hypothetical protein